MRRRGGARFHAFRIEMMLGKGDGLEAQLLGHLRQLGHLLQHLLDFVRPMRDRSQPLALLRRSRNDRIDMEHEFHVAEFLTPFMTRLTVKTSRPPTLAQRRRPKASATLNAAFSRKRPLTPARSEQIPVSQCPCMGSRACRIPRVSYRSRAPAHAHRDRGSTRSW